MFESEKKLGRKNKVLKCIDFKKSGSKNFDILQTFPPLSTHPLFHLQTLSLYSANTNLNHSRLQTRSRHPPINLQTPFRYFPDTYQTPLKYTPDTHKKLNKFHLPSFHRSKRNHASSGWVEVPHLNRVWQKIIVTL